MTAKALAHLKKMPEEENMKDGSSGGLKDNREGPEGEDNLTNLDLDDDHYFSDEDIPVQRMKYYVTFLLDLIKAEWNQDKDPYKWVRRVYAILKNLDKTVAILTDFGQDGKKKMI